MTKINEMLVIKSLHAADYIPTNDAMRERILERIALKKEQGLRSPDELWIVDHNDVYTLGQASKKEHILQQTDTPIIQTDRGGQVTWHGHGQLVIYWLFDLDSLGWSVRSLVTHAEQALEDVINELLNSRCASDNNTTDVSTKINDDVSANFATTFSAKARRNAPGVYIYSAIPSANNSVNRDDSVDDVGDVEQEEAIMLGKIASLGFKIKHGFSYHGLALNINCDLSAFNAINPCGYAGMQMLRLADFIDMDKDDHQGANQDVNQDVNQGYGNKNDTVSYQQVTQRLIDNIAKRHAGQLPLRAVAPK